MEGPKLFAFLHFFTSLLLFKFSRLFFNDGRILQRGGKARVDRRMLMLQTWLSELVCNGAGWPVVGSNAGLFHLFSPPIGCFTTRFQQLRPSPAMDLNWVMSIKLRRV